jgi:hypothetical protein
MVLAAGLAFAVPAAELAGQAVETSPVSRLANACATAVPGGTESQDRLTACAAGAIGAHALQGGLGLLMAAGGPFPASPSTAGQRLQGSPRWVIDVGTGVVRADVPSRSDGAIGAQEGRVFFAPRITVGAGLFEGVSPSPTVGGMGSIDVVGELRLLPIPRLHEVSDRVVAWGLGARIGVIRESFTLPGVTLVAMHRRAGTVEFVSPLGPPGGGVPEARMIRVTPNVTSLRAVAGKDLLEIGVSAGVQLDRIRGDAEVGSWAGHDGAIALPSPGPPPPGSGPRSLPVDRTTWFVGLNRTWVVTQLTAELGWSPAARGDDADVLGGAGAGSAFSGALSFRITY